MANPHPWPYLFTASLSSTAPFPPNSGRVRVSQALVPKYMHPTFHVGKFLVTPLVKPSEGGGFAASVSIRRGMHDRIFRFVPSFASEALAVRYAMRHGRNMARHSPRG